MLRTTLWGILAVAPLPMTYYLYGHVFSTDPTIWPPLVVADTLWGDQWFWIIGLGLGLVVIIIVFMIHAILNERVPLKKKLFWAALILVFFDIATPFYWWFYIRGKKAQEKGTQPF